MKVKYFLIGFFLFWASSLWAQLESEGLPTPFSPLETNATSLRKTNNSPFYITLAIDTTQPLAVRQRMQTIGYSQKTDISPLNQGKGFYDTVGNWIWRVGIVSPGAQSMSVVLDQFEIPAGAQVFVYNPAQTQVLGGFGANNHNEHSCLPIRPLLGDTLILEYQEPANAAFEGQIHIGLVAHNKKSPAFGKSQKCSPHSHYTPLAKPMEQAVCHMYTVNQKGAFYSSGCLLNNPKGLPYLYTAGHCVEDENDEKQTVFYFNYAVTAQDSTIEGTRECTIAGSTLLAKDKKGDFALLQLNQMPPADYQPYLAGWSREEEEDLAPMLCIQHPKGDCKRVSLCYEEPKKRTYPDYSYNVIENGCWWIRRWTKGTTEPGSSGSPLINQENLVIGCLSGGESKCSNPISDYFSRFALAWDYYSTNNKQFKAWLDPNQTGTSKMRGVDPYANAPCVRLKHIQVQDPISSFALKGNRGYLIGHNNSQITSYAEAFQQKEEGWIHGVYLMPCKGKYSTLTPVYLCIYSGDQQPTHLLAKKVIQPQYPSFSKDGKLHQYDKKDWSNAENYIRFDEPIPVNQKFFVGIEVAYDALTPTDSFALYGAYTQKNTAFFKNGEQWTPLSQANHQEAALSMWVEPIWQASHTVQVQEEKASIVTPFPNPTQGNVYWQSNEPTSYQLYNLAGQLLARGKGNTCVLPASGVYVLKIQDQGQTHIHKVIRR